jgi:hypothetical protein
VNYYVVDDPRPYHELSNRDLCLKALALVGVIVALFQWRTANRQLRIANHQRATADRTHLFNVYAKALDLLDETEMRTARNWVYKMDSDAFKPQREGWIAMLAEPPESEVSRREAWKNKQRAEKVARGFDRLGLLVREGRIPINLVARFYVTPILRCWINLRPYVEAVRKDRSQNGHMWEFENLAVEIVLKGAQSDAGVWRGVREHENLRMYQASHASDPIDLLENTKHAAGWHAAYAPVRLWIIEE